MTRFQTSPRKRAKVAGNGIDSQQSPRQVRLEPSGGFDCQVKVAGESPTISKVAESINVVNKMGAFRSRNRLPRHSRIDPVQKVLPAACADNNARIRSACLSIGWKSEYSEWKFQPASLTIYGALTALDRWSGRRNPAQPVGNQQFDERARALSGSASRCNLRPCRRERRATDTCRGRRSGESID